MGYRIRNFKKAERYGISINPATGMLQVTASKMPKGYTFDRFIRLLDKEEVIEHEC